MQEVKVAELIPHPLNNKFFDDVTGQRWEEFLESIKTSGVVEPIVITQSKVIVSGHQRVRACKELGIDTIMAEVKLYDDDKKVIKDLIETNVRQRGTIGGSDQQIVARVEALKDWYGVRHGGDNRTKSTNGTLGLDQQDENLSTMKLDDVLKILGLTEKQYKTAKKITDSAIPEVQQLIDKGTVSRRTVADLIAKLSPEDQKALVDKLPDDVKLTAKSIEEYIEKLRQTLVGNANQVKQESDKLMEENEKLKRENEGLRSGNIPASEEAKTKLEKLEEERKEYLNKYQAAQKSIDDLRGICELNQKDINKRDKEIEQLKASLSGDNDDVIIELQNEVGSLKKELDHKMRAIEDLHFDLEERDEQIEKLKKESKEGFERKALRLNETPEEFSRRERDSLVSETQTAIGMFISSLEGLFTQSDSFSKVDSLRLKTLVETCSQAVSAGTKLKMILLSAAGVNSDMLDDDTLDNRHAS